MIRRRGVFDGSREPPFGNEGGRVVKVDRREVDT